MNDYSLGMYGRVDLSAKTNEWQVILRGPRRYLKHIGPPIESDDLPEIPASAFEQAEKHLKDAKARAKN